MRDLKREKNPIGVVEIFLVESIALDIVRSQRARQLEAQYITGLLNPPITDGSATSELLKLFGGGDTIVDPGLPALMDCAAVKSLVVIFQRYESIFAVRLFRNLHELERIQRMRQGEHLPAPIALDVAVQTDNTGLDSFAESADTEAIEGSLSEPRDKREDPSPGVNSPEVEAATSVELDVDADAGGLVSLVEPPKIEFLEGSGVELPDDEHQAIVAPQEGEAAETPTDEDE
jgi:hypothetical protein